MATAGPSYANLLSPIDPTSAVNAYSIQRQQALAQALQAQALTPASDDLPKNMPIMPKVGMGLGMVKLAQALMAGSASESADAAAGNQQQKNMALMLQAMGGGQQAQQSPQADPSSQALTQGAAQGSVGPTVDNAQRMDSMPPQQPQQPQSGSMNPLNMPPTFAAQFAMNNFPEFLKTQAGAFAPTEATKMAMASGGDVRQANSEALMKANNIAPVAGRGAPLLTLNKATGKYEIDPASVEAMKMAEASKAQYQAPFTLKTSTGQEVQLSPPEFKQFQENGGRLPTRFLPPELQTGIQNDVNNAGEARNVDLKTPQGQVGGSFQPKGIGQIGVSQSPFDKALDEKTAGNVSEMESGIYDKGAHALEKVAQNNKMISLLPSIVTGPLNKQITMVKGLAGSLGVDIGDPSSNQEFDKYALQGALSAAKQIYGGRLTNQDVTTQIASNPGSTLAERATYQLLKWDNETQQRNIQQMQAYRQYKQSGQSLRDFPLYFAQNYPYQGVSAPSGDAKDFKITTPPNPIQPKPAAISSKLKANANGGFDYTGQ